MLTNLSFHKEDIQKHFSVLVLTRLHLTTKSNMHEPWNWSLGFAGLSLTNVLIKMCERP